MENKKKDIDEFIKSSLNAIIEKNGLIYTEQKFCSIFNTFEKLVETSAFGGELNVNSRKEYYEYFFPNLAPKLNNIRSVYDKALNRSEIFEFHPSEIVFNSWIKNITKNPPSIKDCEILVDVYESWLNWHNEIKSIQFRSIKDKILLDIKSNNIDFNNYQPGNSEVNYHLSKCFDKSQEVKISDRNELKQNCIYVLGINENNQIKVKTHKVIKVDSLELQNWLSKIGIDLSLTTCQFLLEFGFPYCGYLIEPQNIFSFSGNTKSIIGLLAYNLNSKKSGYDNDILNESAVLALSRLEYFISLTKPHK